MIQNVPTSSMRLDICLRSRCELRDVAGYADKYENSEFPVEKLEKVEPADNETVEERAALFSRRLYLEVKRGLRFTRNDDTEVRLELPIAQG